MQTTGCNRPHPVQRLWYFLAQPGKLGSGHFQHVRLRTRRPGSGGKAVPWAVGGNLEPQSGWDSGSCSITNSRVPEQTTRYDGQLPAQGQGLAQTTSPDDTLQLWGPGTGRPKGMGEEARMSET